MKIACIICTKDRPKDLESLLTSISIQTKRIDQIIVVDGSDHPIKHITDLFPALAIDYIEVRPPGLTKQRNIGISKISPDIDWVGMLDDDLVLEVNCIENLTTFIPHNNNLAGVGLVINNQPTFKNNILRSIFLTDLEPGGRLTKSGMAAAIRPVNKDLKVEWLYGGATFWKSQIFNKYKFDEWYSGVGYLEDVDFSYRLSRENDLMLCSSARCFHFNHPIKPEKFIQMGAWYIVSWWYFSSKYKFNRLFTLWSMSFVFFSNLAKGLIKPSSKRIRLAFGNLKGFLIILKGEVKQHQGFQK